LSEHVFLYCERWAAVVFAVSVTLRSLDLALCDVYAIEGRKIGTHFAWHLLNGLALFLLLRASLEVGPINENRAVAQPRSSRALPPPEEAAKPKDRGRR
jgi:hypothetical protein